MIFLTLGTQIAFNRIIEAVDQAVAGLDEEVFGQIGNSTYQPKNFETQKFMSQSGFDDKFKAARVVVAHAGMGTILSAMKAQKPLIVMARKFEFGEHRNDHQSATVAQMRSLPGLHVADTSDDIRALLTQEALEPMSQSASPNRERLITTLRSEIFGA